MSKVYQKLEMSINKFDTVDVLTGSVNQYDNEWNDPFSTMESNFYGGGEE